MNLSWIIPNSKLHIRIAFARLEFGQLLCRRKEVADLSLAWICFACFKSYVCKKASRTNRQNRQPRQCRLCRQTGRQAGSKAAGSKAAGSSGLIVFVMLWHVMTMMIAEKKCISVQSRAATATTHCFTAAAVQTEVRQNRACAALQEYTLQQKGVGLISLVLFLHLNKAQKRVEVCPQFMFSLLTTVDRLKRIHDFKKLDSLMQREINLKVSLCNFVSA